MSFSPTNLDNYIGQENVKRNIKICINAGKYRGYHNPLEHILLCGPPGLGKTSLGEIIAKELQRPIKKYLGPRIKTIKDLSFLGTLTPWEVIFIDEIHGLPAKVEEALYEPMDTFKWNGEIVWPFTLIGTTTKLGSLSKPFQSRFTVVETLVPYNKSELSIIIKMTANLMKIRIDEGASQVIAARSRGTPRTANQLLKRVAYYSQHITAEIARNALDSIGIDK